MKGRSGRERPAAKDHATTVRMKAVRTAPELAVRRMVWRLGARYRTCVRSLPGKPDLANVSRRWCIFVHGCYWHGHPGCRGGRPPKTNVEWWREKIEANRTRDRAAQAALEDMGFRVLLVWQCELSDPIRLQDRLERFFLGDP